MMMMMMMRALVVVVAVVAVVDVLNKCSIRLKLVSSSLEEF